MTGLKFVSKPVYGDECETAVKDCLKRDDVLLLKCILGVGRETDLQMTFHEHNVLYLARSAGERKLIHLSVCKKQKCNANYPGYPCIIVFSGLSLYAIVYLKSGVV